jgi:hypothetical protein
MSVSAGDGLVSCEDDKRVLDPAGENDARFSLGVCGSSREDGDGDLTGHPRRSAGRALTLCGGEAAADNDCDLLCFPGRLVDLAGFGSS